MAEPLAEEIRQAPEDPSPLDTVNGWRAHMGLDTLAEWPEWNHTLPVQLGNPVAQALECAVFVYGEGDFAFVVSRHPNMPASRGRYNRAIFAGDGAEQGDHLVGPDLARIAWTGIKRRPNGMVAQCPSCGQSLARPQAGLPVCCRGELSKWRDG